MTQPNPGHPFGQLRQRTDQLIVFCDVARFDRLSHQQPDELLGDRRAVHYGLIVDGLAGDVAGRAEHSRRLRRHPHRNPVRADSPQPVRQHDVDSVGAHLTIVAARSRGRATVPQADRPAKPSHSGVTTTTTAAPTMPASPRPASTKPYRSLTPEYGS